MIALASPESIRRSNLACALYVLPTERRRHALVFYRFCRAVDDLADDPSAEKAKRRETLAAWRCALESGTGLPCELQHTLETCGIDGGLLVEIIRGCEMDLEPTQFKSMDDLLSYCWKVACAVGLVSIKIFGCRHPGSSLYAEHLGYALQLTNILRDVGEDAAMGRVYLPEDLLASHGADRAMVLRREPNPRLHAVLKDLGSLARSRFASAAATLPAEDLSALLPARIMAAVYARLLDKIETSGYDVLSRRIRISTFQKILLFGSVWRSGKYPHPA